MATSSSSSSSSGDKHPILENITQFPDVEDSLRSVLKKMKLIDALDGKTQTALAVLEQKFQRDLLLEGEQNKAAYHERYPDEAKRPAPPAAHPYVLECLQSTNDVHIYDMMFVTTDQVALIKKRYRYEETKKQLQADLASCMGYLEEFLGVTYRTMIDFTNDPHTAWRFIDSLFNKGDVVNRVNLLVTILKKDIGQMDLQGYLQKKQRLRSRIIKAGLEVTDDLFIAIVLATLPDELELTKTLLEDKANLSLQQLESSFLNAEKKWSQIKSRKHPSNFSLPDSEENGNTLTPPSPKKSKKEKDEKHQVCGHCFRNNHRTVACKINPGLKPNYNEEMAKRYAARFWSPEVNSASTTKTG
eukprot:TRINITY_DN16133_c0_g1_i1.p1 TRINITY_DN16133_c0_g1~~TRINITY_DN16133_c0_g1_i1.p1  ORF type:complete len:358 (+),score=90.61 TRINITY_DN16133_c0_g1_i1:230-1303(+)